jgi:hypothetical protein
MNGYNQLFVRSLKTMPIINLYSKRKKLTEKGNQPEVYQYEELPLAFRRQVVHIWLDALPKELWQIIHDLLARELGLFELSFDIHGDPFKQCEKFLLDSNTSSDNLLDIIELSFKFFNAFIHHKVENRLYHFDPYGFEKVDSEESLSQHRDEVIRELNHRFYEHAIGYQFEDGQIIRVDSQFIHAEVVIPALRLLSNPNFAGPEQEFRSAHQHYRCQEYKDAIVDALNSFESTIKSICDMRGWIYPKTASAKELINVIFKNQLIPQYLETYFAGLRQVLEAGVPTVRNKTSGHGQGATPTYVPEHLAAYVLHLTASNIIMLIEAHKALP